MYSTEEQNTSLDNSSETSGSSFVDCGPINSSLINKIDSYLTDFVENEFKEMLTNLNENKNRRVKKS